MVQVIDKKTGEVIKSFEGKSEEVIKAEMILGEGNASSVGQVTLGHLQTLFDLEYLLIKN